MDLKTVRQRIRDGQISSIDEFEHDVQLIFTNALMYNEEGEQVWVMAEEMKKDVEKYILQARSLQQDIER